MTINDYINQNNGEHELFNKEIIKLNIPSECRIIVEVQNINQKATAFYFEDEMEMERWEDEFPPNEDYRRIHIEHGPDMLNVEVTGHGAWNAVKAAALDLYINCTDFI